MDQGRDPNLQPEPSMMDLMREIQRLHHCMDRWEHRQRRSTLVGSKVRDVKRFDRRNIPAATPARKCLKCHGFGHSVPECPTENFIVDALGGTGSGVKEEKKPIWDEDPFEEHQSHAEEDDWTEKMFQKEVILDTSPKRETAMTRTTPPQIQADEVSWSPSEVESDKVIWDDVPCMIIPPEPSEMRLPLLLNNPCGISQPQESVQVRHPIFMCQPLDHQEAQQLGIGLIRAPPRDRITGAMVTLILARVDELSRDPLEIETIDMVLPPTPLTSGVHVLLEHNKQPPLEYKYLPLTAIPKIDLTWVKVKTKKVSVGSLSKLRCKASVSTSSQGETTAWLMMKTSPPPRENDRGGLVTVAICYSNYRYYSEPLQ